MLGFDAVQIQVLHQDKIIKKYFPMRCSCYIINKLHTMHGVGTKEFSVLWLLLKRQSDIIILFVIDEKKSRKSSDRLPLSIS